jgi:hypothetical protein
LGAVLVVGYVAHAATHRDPDWEAGQAARRALGDLSREDDRLLAVANQVLMQTPSARLPAEIDARLVRPWEAIAAALSNPAPTGLEPGLEQARRYAAMQAEYWRGYATALGKDTPARREQLDAMRRELDVARRAVLGR